MTCRDTRGAGPDRRTVLTALTAATTAGLAGCLSPGGGSGTGGTPTDASGGSGDDGGGGGGNAASGAISCSSLTDGVAAHDTGAIPVVFDFEYPAVFEEILTTENSNNVVFTALRDSADLSFSLQLVQSTQPIEEGSQDRAVAATTEFDGDTIEFYGGTATNPIVWGAFLPWEKDGDVRYFSVTLSLSASGTDADACREALQTAAETLVASITVNADTTIETEYAGQ